MSTTQVHTLRVKVRQFATQLRNFMIAFVLLSVCPVCMIAQDSHSHSSAQQLTADQRNQRSNLSNCRECRAFPRRERGRIRIILNLVA